MLPLHGHVIKVGERASDLYRTNPSIQAEFKCYSDILIAIVNKIFHQCFLGQFSHGE